ncbi:MAG: hypothetical protein EAZ97_01915 [Bacteroidetes bacterium]|nr:MAG: hypothetical protein EAZ97_01915 [Bacteroidota bacterium]
MPNLVKEVGRYGIYQNKMFGQSHPKIEVIHVEELLSGKRMSLPIKVEVLKKAERKTQTKGIQDIF